MDDYIMKHILCAAIAFGVGLPLVKLYRKAGGRRSGFFQVVVVGAIIGVLMAFADILNANIDPPPEKANVMRIAAGTFGGFLSWVCFLFKDCATSLTSGKKG